MCLTEHKHERLRAGKKVLSLDTRGRDFFFFLNKLLLVLNNLLTGLMPLLGKVCCGFDFHES